MEVFANIQTWIEHVMSMTTEEWNVILMSIFGSGVTVATLSAFAIAIAKKIATGGVSGLLSLFNTEDISAQIIEKISTEGIAVDVTPIIEASVDEKFATFVSNLESGTLSNVLAQLEKNKAQNDLIAKSFATWCQACEESVAYNAENKVVFNDMKTKLLATIDVPVEKLATKAVTTITTEV